MTKSFINIRAGALLALVTSIQLSALAQTSSANPNLLWYDEPASRWTEALPVGNGRIGAMVFGGVSEDRLQLNEGTLWAGGPYDPVNPQAKEALPQVRQLVNEGKYREAAQLLSARVMAKPLGQMPYQTVGSLHLTFADGTNVSDYRRELNLDTATATTAYTANGVRYTREVFANAPDNVIVVRLTADQRQKISFTAGMRTPMRGAAVTTDGDDTLVMNGTGGDANGIKGQLKYQARVKVIAKGGKVSAADGKVTVTDANEVVLLSTAATSFKRFDDVSGDPEAIVKKTLGAAAKKSFAKLQDAHLKDFQPLFRRVSLDLGRSDAMKLTTDERIKQFAGGNDPQLAALYYQFARYLLISCSRPGGQPATLQGLWNESLNPPWQSKYTININTEMNYWPAESGNLAECVDPLIEMVKELTVTGGRTAKNMYGARGWVAHHNTDLWRATAPIDGPNWGMWPTGGAWLALHLWDRYEFGGDKAFLKEIYPILKSASEFFVDTLQEDPKGKWLVTNPSVSPENGHPFGSSVCAGPTMDQQILRDLFANTIKAAEILGQDKDFAKQLTATRARLAPNQIGSNGQLQEWMEDWDMRAPEMRHRHVSHLYGLFPGRDVHRHDTPEFAKAVAKSLDIRGDRATGWATAWRICLWTHLGDGNRAYQIIKHLITPELTYPNMFDAHPPFQIDGNFGGASGIADMLMQSRMGTVTDPLNAELKPEIELLPALPSAWPAGSMKGLRARGGFEVDVTWRDGKLVAARVKTIHKGKKSVTVRHGGHVTKLELKSGGEVWLDADLQRTAKPK